MLKAFVFGLVAAGALFIGALLAVLVSRKDTSERREQLIGRANRTIMAFGAGVLLCTVAFELMEDAYKKGGFDHVTVGFLTGAIVFLGLDLWLDHMGSGVELLLGALLDGIPESAVIGIGLVAQKGLGLIMMIAVFISNFPEGFSGTRDMLSRDHGKTFKVKNALILWGSVTIVCALSTLVGYQLLGQATPSWIAFMLAVAAGAILAMVSHTMIPEAFEGVWEYTRRKSGTRFLIGDKIEAMAVIAGFLVSFILSRIT